MQKQKPQPARKNPLPLARTLAAALWACIAADLLLAFTTWLDMGVMQMVEPTMGFDVFSDSYAGLESLLSGLSAILYLLAYLVAAFLTLKWIYRVNKNAKTLSPDKEISPGWAVGWYFVPLAALYMPFKAMKETWQISHSPNAWRQEPIPSLLRWWWGLLLVSSVLANLSGQLAFRATSVGEMIVSSQASLISTCFSVPLCLVLSRVVKRLSEVQAAVLGIGVSIETDESKPALASS